MSTISCPSCSADLPAVARFCSDCGTRVGARPGPVTWEIAEPRYFGVLPGRRILRSAKLRLGRGWAMTLGRMRVTREAVAAYTVTELELMGLRREAADLAAERTRIVYGLGEAVYRDDRREVKRAKARLAELDQRLAAAERSTQAAHERMHDRIEQAQLEGGRTRRFAPAEAIEPPPDVPEPTPVPHVPPGPVVVPEPEPVPHEPPGPVIVPEPEPPRDVS